MIVWIIAVTLGLYGTRSLAPYALGGLMGVGAALLGGLAFSK
jgi:hypothetical protein